MARKLLTAALILTLALTAASCGTKNAGTSANHWMKDDTLGTSARDADRDKGQGWADTARNESWGPLAEGRYAADEKGRVKGYDASLNGSGLNTSGYDAKKNNTTAEDAAKDTADRAKDSAKNAANKAKHAGDDLADGMKDAARSIGNAAENALDDMTDHAQKAKDNQKAADQNVQQNANGTTTQTPG